MNITIGICTYRRNSIKKTLLSLEKMNRPDHCHLNILVADNDDTPSAQPLVTEISQTLTLPVQYIHAPARNISLARNAILENTHTPYLAFIDDDEHASPQWLIELLAPMTPHMAATFGPVRAVYPDTAPDWAVQGDFHSSIPYAERGAVRTGFSGNVLINLHHVAVRDKKFALEKGRTGGEDTDYFFQIFADGGKMAIADQAVIYEDIPASRLTHEWLAPRRFRSGQSYGAHCGLGQKLLAIIKAGFSKIMAWTFFWSPLQQIKWKLRAEFHSGVIANLFGKSEAELY